MMTRPQAEALATFVNRMRPDWDHPGIVSALSKAASLGGPLDVAHALLILAENRELKSPGMLHQQGKHWKRADGENTGPNISHNVRCPEHPINFHPCPLCAAKKCPPDEEYLKAKAELAARRPIPTVQKRLADFAASKEVTP
jgi:hypothetical protein